MKNSKEWNEIRGKIIIPHSLVNILKSIWNRKLKETSREVFGIFFNNNYIYLKVIFLKEIARSFSGKSFTEIKLSENFLNNVSRKKKFKKETI